MRTERRRAKLIEDLRLSIDCLPLRTRVAMLEGVRSSQIIVGAYVDRQGGVCPMLAAHRHGGRTDFLAFAKSWDRFTRAPRPGRRATKREVSILTGQLEASLLNELTVDFDVAIREHRELCRRHERARTCDPVGEILVSEKRRSRWLSRRLERSGAAR